MKSAGLAVSLWLAELWTDSTSVKEMNYYLGIPHAGFSVTVGMAVGDAQWTSESFLPSFNGVSDTDKVAIFIFSHLNHTCYKILATVGQSWFFFSFNWNNVFNPQLLWLKMANSAILFLITDISLSKL